MSTKGILQIIGLVVAFAFEFIAAHNADAAVWYEALFDTAIINPDLTLTEDGVTYSIANAGNYNLPRLFTSGAYSGRSLNISLPQSVQQSGAVDRFEYEWVQPTDANAPHFDGVMRYFGIRFKLISAQSQPPTNGGVILTQMWQGSPYAPAIWIDIKVPGSPGNPWPNRLWIHNGTTGQYTSDQAINLYDGTISEDVWTLFVLGVRPGWGGNGEIEFLINGNLVADFKGQVGYQPASQGGLPGTLDGLMIKSGAYRNSGNPPIGFGFDNMKYGSSYFDVSQRKN
jgi:hypothetical protein